MPAPGVWRVHGCRQGLGGGGGGGGEGRLGVAQAGDEVVELGGAVEPLEDAGGAGSDLAEAGQRLVPAELTDVLALGRLQDVERELLERRDVRLERGGQRPVVEGEASHARRRDLERLAREALDGDPGGPGERVGLARRLAGEPQERLHLVLAVGVGDQPAHLDQPVVETAGGLVALAPEARGRLLLLLVLPLGGLQDPGRDPQPLGEVALDVLELRQVYRRRSFGCAGLEPAGGRSRVVSIRATGDFPWMMPQWKDVANRVTNLALSATGKRAAVEARGEIFTIPAEKGDVTYVYAFSAIAVFILLIACFNFMNLATARSMQRAKEVGMRKVIGATRSQLVRQFLGESALLALVAFVLALVLVAAALPAFRAFTEKTLPFGLAENAVLVAALLAGSLAVGLVAGSYPALYLSGFNPIRILKGAAVSGGRSAATLRKGLVVAQFAITIALIIGTTIVYRQLDYLRNTNLGFQKDQVVVLPIRGEIGDNVETVKQELLRLRAKQLSRCRELLEEWAKTHGGRLHWTKPRAGAICFFGYSYDTDSAPFVERLIRERSTMIVPGAHFLAERHLRIGFGPPEATLRAGLAEIDAALSSLEAAPVSG